MTDREKLAAHAEEYMILGDLDKPFHRPECECKACEAWRTSKDRPTHKELRAKEQTPPCD